MEFKYYDPKRLVPALKERGAMAWIYVVCPGCVYTHVPPEDCIRSRDEMVETAFQSDMLCEHCAITSEEMGEAIHFGEDPSVSEKMAELEEILRMMQD